MTAPMTPNLDQERVERAAAVLDPWAFEGGSGTADNRADAIAMARAAITAYLGDTHVVVPREPTLEMQEAFYKSCDEHGMVLWRSGYRALIAATPTVNGKGT